jgi:hypothetical protein
VIPTPEQLQEKMKKRRRRSIQKHLNLRVIQEAVNEARLEESAMEESIFDREIQLLENRRQAIRLAMAIATARRDNVLVRLGNRVESSLDRLTFATETLRDDSARKVQKVEEDHTRSEAANQRELQLIAAEETAKRDSHRLRKIDREVFHGRDTEKAEEDLIEGIQASESEEMPSEEDEIVDEDEEDAISEDEEEDDEDQDD